MARIAGVDLPKNERVEIGLTRIFGIGRALSIKILSEINVNPDIRVKDLTDADVVKIRSRIEKEFKVEGDLRREIAMNVKRLADIGSYRGMRHAAHLPVRGQRTKTNARTRRGPRKLVLRKKS